MHEEGWKRFVVNEHMKLVNAMERIDQNSGEVLFVTDDDGILCGAVSDGDVRRWILKTGRLDAEIAELMNRAPIFLYEGEEKKAYQVMQDQQCISLPIVDEQSHIINVVGVKDKQHQFVKRKEQLTDVPVIIMAGGKGTRLYPYTKILPKPLIPIGDVPVMERIIDEFCGFGMKNFYISVNYKKNMIRSYFSELEANYQLQYVEEEEPLGTAGSIGLIDEKFENPVFVTNCDILIRADYADIYKHHSETGNAITIVTALKNDTIPYGVIHSKENGEIISMEEKPQRSYMVNTGMYIINPDMIELIPRNTFFHMTQLTDIALQKGYRVGMYPISEDSFLDMGELAEMKRMEEKLNL